MVANADTGILAAKWKEFISPSVFCKPAYLPLSAWTEHIPFAYWLVDCLRPKTIVELGTYYGCSYFSFCQAVKQSGLNNTSCFAVDNWLGDIHAGFYGEDVYQSVRQRNEDYNSFSELLRKDFSEALNDFQDNSIDLLHIDGEHSYESVKRDFYSWLPKLSEQAIILLHDIMVIEKDFGVFRFWKELTTEYHSFTFEHGFGLGVLTRSKELRGTLGRFFQSQDNGQLHRMICSTYERLGKLIALEIHTQLPVHIVDPAGSQEHPT